MIFYGVTPIQQFLSYIWTDWLSWFCQSLMIESMGVRTMPRKGGLADTCMLFTRPSSLHVLKLFDEKIRTIPKPGMKSIQTKSM